MRRAGVVGRKGIRLTSGACLSVTQRGEGVGDGAVHSGKGRRVHGPAWAAQRARAKVSGPGQRPRVGSESELGRFG